MLSWICWQLCSSQFGLLFIYYYFQTLLCWIWSKAVQASINSSNYTPHPCWERYSCRTVWKIGLFWCRAHVTHFTNVSNMTDIWLNIGYSVDKIRCEPFIICEIIIVEHMQIKPTTNVQWKWVYFIGGHVCFVFLYISSCGRNEREKERERRRQRE